MNPPFKNGEPPQEESRVDSALGAVIRLHHRHSAQSPASQLQHRPGSWTSAFEAQMGPRLAKQAPPEKEETNGDTQMSRESQAGILKVSFHGQSILMIGLLIGLAVIAFFVAKRYMKKKKATYRQNLVSALEMRETWKKEAPVAKFDKNASRFIEVEDKSIGSALPESCKYLAEI